MRLFIISKFSDENVQKSHNFRRYITVTNAFAQERRE